MSNRKVTRKPQFGQERAGQDYVLRPGGYGLIRRSDGAVAIVSTPRGAFLIGGGREEGETPKEALIREAREECGCTLRVGRRVAIADEFVFERDEGIHVRKRCSFFYAEILATNPRAARDSDHVLDWVSLKAAVGRLSQPSQRWAMQYAFTPRPDKFPRD